MDTSLLENIKKEVSLPEQVASQISQLIIDQHLVSGDKMPSELELVSKLHVGRGTIREAIKLMVSRNILVVRRGLGTFIADRTGQTEDPLGFAFYPDQNQLSLDLQEVRVQFEPWVARAAAQRATEENMKELKARCLLVEEDIMAGRDHLQHDVDFHVCIAQCTQNMVVPNLIPIISYSVGLFGTLTGKTLLSDTIVCHRAIAEAICEQNPELASRKMLEHLEQNRKELTRIIAEMDTEPI